MTVQLTVRGHGRHGTLQGSWNTRSRGARALVHGSFGGHRLTADFRAP